MLLMKLRSWISTSVISNQLAASWRLALAALFLLGASDGATSGTSKPSQIQVARRFLLAVLHGEFQAAHGMLAPEVGRAITPAQFQAVAMPLYQKGQHFKPTIDLYKLGFRLRDGQTPQSFVAFMFKADTLAARPEVQLDVTFRDSTARQILSFGLIPLGEPIR